MSDFWESYAGQLRKAIGNQKIIVPAAIAIIQDRQERILLIQKRDGGRWGLPAGMIELGESCWDCLTREVKEETGLDILTATPMALYSDPRFDYTNSHGQEYQLFSMAFRVDRWSGKLIQETDETINARYYSLDNLPEVGDIHREIIDDYKQFTGQLILK